VTAGAELIVSMPCFDAETHVQYVADARAMGVRCTILPGVLPIGPAAAEFRRVCRAISVEVPAWLDEQIRSATTSAALAKLSNSLLTRHVRDLALRGAAAPHVYTLNSTDVLEPLRDAGFQPLKHRL